MPYNERVSNYANVQLYIHLNFLENHYLYVFMAETFEIMFSCGSLSCIHFAPELKD